MTDYIVYRIGWNAVNQRPDAGVPDKMPVFRVRADSAEEACRIASQSVTVEPNQHLAAEPAGAVDAHEENLNLKAEALERGAGQGGAP